MKVSLLMLLMVSLVTCVRSDISYNKAKYMTYEEFKKNYFYFRDQNYEHNMLLPSGFSSIVVDNAILLNFIQKKESNLKKLSKFKNDIIDEFGYKEKIIQLGSLILETNIENKVVRDENILLFFNSLLGQIKKNIGAKEFYKVIEGSFTEDEIYILISILTYNSEFEYYEVEDKLGLAKVDKINEKLRMKEEITEEEWLLREGKPYKKIFENEVSQILGVVYLLSNNKIIVINEEKEILKELKIKDYKETGFLIYKDILYISSDKKIYEVPLNNLNKIDITEIK